jgi:arginine decarboxylase-like protein
MKIITDEGKELQFKNYIFLGFEEGSKSELMNCSSTEMADAKCRLEYLIFNGYLQDSKKEGENHE